MAQPDAAIPPPAQIGAALAGYCSERIDQLDVQRAQVKRLGRKQLAAGLVFLGACLALGSALSVAQLGPD